MENRLRKILNFCIISMFFIAACASPEDPKPVEAESLETVQEKATEYIDNSTINNEEDNTKEVVMEKNKKVAVVLSRDRYQSLEYNPVAEALQKAGYEIIIASDAVGEAKGTTENTPVDIAFSDINTKELLAIVLIGGSNSLWNNSELHQLLNEMQEMDKVIAAICYGSVTLAKAGVIGDGDIACWYNSAESDPEMEKEGVIDSKQDVTISGKLITGDGPSAAAEFAEVLVDILGEE
ncbi:MAG: DJ-1/PfpI family protein [Clostridia bacterium]|nr:DJ-1/PfpI family protein [Clostridia bacterium]